MGGRADMLDHLIVELKTFLSGKLYGKDIEGLEIMISESGGYVNYYFLNTLQLDA